MSLTFPVEEFRGRLARAQAAMDKAGLGAIMLTTEPEFRYFTGFLTRFWESPSRPWFLVIPVSGAPVAVIPSIGEVLMRRTWVTDIRTWAAPDPVDDGVTLLADTLREVAGPVGVPSGAEMPLRMPLRDYARVQTLCGQSFRDDAGIVSGLRAIKSEAEVARIKTTCGVANRAFDRMGEIAREGEPISSVFRGFQRLLLEEGADWVPYISGGAGPDGYDDVISPASDAPLRAGDVMMLDTGAVVDGYFCDFDRNFAITCASDVARHAHAQLIEATHAAFEAVRPGARACDVFAAMEAITGGGEGAGRLGHGLGMQLTEGLSLSARDHSEIKPGMVLTLEPGIETTPGRLMVHEENIVVREAGNERLSRFAGPELPVI